MEEEKRLPKNIRQIAEKEDRVRVYLEDYVYTFIHKMQGKAAVRAGVLLGNRVVAEDKSCWFVKGAVELEEMVCPNGIVFSEEIWKDAEDTIKQYFADCSICGWFISAKEDRFPDKEMLKKLHQQVFSGDNCLMYWKDGQDDCVWMEEDGKPVLLKGYYVYYERNPQMQEYMVSRKEPEGEDVDDEAARNFRKIMKEKQDTHLKGRPESVIRFGTAAAVAVLFVGSVYLFGRLAGSDDREVKDGSVQALAVGASVERRSGIFDELLEGLSDEETSGEQASEEPSGQPEVTKEAGGDQVSGGEAEETEEKPAGIFTDDMEFYKDGLGAAVYRITAPKEEETQEHSLGQPAGQDGEVPEGQTQEEAASESDPDAVAQADAPGTGQVAAPTEPEAQNAAEAAATAQRPQSYIIQPGDTLIDISNRFYGSSGMVMQICEANGLADVNTIYIGQTIILP